VVQQQLADFCRAEGIRCLDLLPTLARAGSGAFIDYDHLSTHGSQLVADTLRASGLLAEAVSDPVTLGEALARRSAPGARKAAGWLERRQGVPEPDAIAAMADVLTQGGPSERQAAAWALGAAGPAARALVPAPIAPRGRRNWRARLRAALGTVARRSDGALRGRSSE
jgi:hypothetical protein